MSYYPILLAKSGELTALQQLSGEAKETIIPVLSVLPGSFGRVENFMLDHWNFPGNRVLIDFSLLVPFERRHVETLIRTLFDNEIDAVPVIQTNSPEPYLDIVRDFQLLY